MTTPARRWRRSRNGSGRGLFERAMFSFMGPPQLGDVNSPSTIAADPEAALCHRCRQPWERHERVHTGSMTYRRCPGAQA